MKTTEIASVTDLITRCGGLKATADILGTTSQNIVNWRANGGIPPVHYKRHRKRLSDRRIAVSDALWRFDDVAWRMPSDSPVPE